MPSSTPRLGLYLPGGGSLSIGGDDEVADIDKINQNMLDLDDVVGAAPVTHATRPSTPFPGQVISETDTGDAFRWDDSTGQWRQLHPHVGTTPPEDPVEGFLWVDTN